MSKEPKINFTRDPRSEEFGTEQDQQFLAFVKELDALCRKHKYPAYLLTVCRDDEFTKRALFSTAVSTMDPEMAAGLLADSYRGVRNLIAYLNPPIQPTAPGGVA